MWRWSSRPLTVPAEGSRSRPIGGTVFAAVFYDKPNNQLSQSTGTPLLNAVHGVHVPGVQAAAGGQVIENAEGFSVGPATAVGALAAW